LIYIIERVIDLLSVLLSYWACYWFILSSVLLTYIIKRTI